MNIVETKASRKPAMERKAEIVEVAIRLAADVGPDRLTTDRLAREIGISQAAIFRHFATKSEIWEAVGQKICETLGTSSDAVTKIMTPGQQLKTLVVGQLAFINKTPAVPAILFSRELHAENETLRLFFVEMMEKRHAKLALLIKKAQESGEYCEHLNADDGAYLILALIQGLAMRWSLNGRNFDLAVEGVKLLDVLIASFVFETNA